MRGSPLFRALASFAVILLMGVPLWKLTRPLPAVAFAPTPAPPAKTDAIHLQFDFTAQPASVTIRSLGKEIWKTPSPESGMEKDLEVPFPREGIDLEFEVNWPGDALSALRVRMRDPSGHEYERSIWGKGNVSEVLTFP